MTFFLLQNSLLLRLLFIFTTKHFGILLKIKLGTTDKGVEYGTISMAKNLYKLIKEGHQNNNNAIPFEMAFSIVGKSLDDAGERYLKLIENI